MPDEDEAQVEEQLKNSEQTAIIILPPSAPKDAAPAPTPPPPATQATRKSTREIRLSQKAKDIQAATTITRHPGSKEGHQVSRRCSQQLSMAKRRSLQRHPPRLQGEPNGGASGR